MVKSSLSTTANNLRVLTYNLWHGLSGQGFLRFTDLESDSHRQRRYREQIPLVQSVEPDVVFFQEVNPLEERKTEWLKALGGVALGQVDNSGTKLWGRGFPHNLNSGLLTWLHSDWRIEQHWGVQLSGDSWAQNHQNWSLQLTENRYALFVVADHPNWGRTLLVNTHLHHGLEATGVAQDRIHELEQLGELSTSQAWTLLSRLRHGDQRRELEMMKLINETDRFNKIQTVIVGGDFNSAPTASWRDSLFERGFQDAWSNAEDPGYTWDFRQNQKNHESLADFKCSVKFKDLKIKGKALGAIERLLFDLEMTPRRIDHIYWKGQVQQLGVKKAQLLKWNKPQVVPSDHFGVLIDFEASDTDS